MEVTKDMRISDLVRMHPDTAIVFTRFGMHCFGCAVARFEDIEQGALAHGINVDLLVTALNELIKDGKTERD